MNSLRSLQERCYRAFLLGEAEPLLPELMSREIPAPISIQVYQNNARETYRKALAANYPVVERLVGDDCFRGFALKYMRDYPSTSGDLQRFGATLPDFLCEHYRDSRFAYLPDVARLEWAVEEVQLSRESGPLDLDALSRIEPEHYTEVRFHRSESARLICSPYPILSIWRTNQPGQEAEVDLSSGAEHVVVRRHAGSVQLNLIDSAAASLAAHLGDAETLEEATAALDSEFGDGQSFDLTTALQQLTGTGLLTRFTLEQPTYSQ